jgi:hypothetical protein
MGLQNFNESTAFAPGSQLWILPDPRVSHWARKIDWYLNFQIARAERHLPPVLEPGLLQLLRDEQLDPPTTLSNTKAPLLLSSGHRLPAHQTVEISFTGDFSGWLAQAAGIWRDLGHPPLRLFLPQGTTSAQVEALWPGEKSQMDYISTVADNDFGTSARDR